MIIKRMVLRNFKKFYGTYEVEFQKGMNVVVGPGLSGKTTLAMAFKFAALGQTDTPRNKLVNGDHKLQCKEAPSCRVEVEIDLNGRPCFIQRELSLSENEIRESLRLDADIDEIITPEAFENIYLGPLNPIFAFKGNTDLSTAAYITEKICDHIKQKVEPNIKMVFLDGLFARLTSELGKKVLDYIVNSKLEQTIIMDKWGLPELESYSTRPVIRIFETITHSHR